MDVNVSVKINASPEQAWSVFKDKKRWIDWYGVPVKAVDWRENGSIRYGGQYGGVSGLANYREAETVAIVGHWADDIYSVRADGNGCVFSKRICPKNGANFTASGYPNECIKQQDYLDKFRDIVEKEYPRQGISPDGRKTVRPRETGERRKQIRRAKGQIESAGAKRILDPEYRHRRGIRNRKRLFDRGSFDAARSIYFDPDRAAVLDRRREDAQKGKYRNLRARRKRG